RFHGTLWRRKILGFPKSNAGNSGILWSKRKPRSLLPPLLRVCILKKKNPKRTSVQSRRQKQPARKQRSPKRRNPDEIYCGRNEPDPVSGSYLPEDGDFRYQGQPSESGRPRAEGALQKG